MDLDPITLSVLTSALVGIAEEMGLVLVRGAYSSNIKERRDCSTALFDADGLLVAQAEHIPVHLGAMPESVAAVRARGAQPGDVYALNDPYAGGTHLPDITLISPLALDGVVAGYAVTRAHHSDVGGMRPGSMPADSRDLWQEGLVIPPVRLVRDGQWVPDVLDLIMANSRTPALRRGDFRAQVAANWLAERRLRELVGRWGAETVRAAFHDVLAYTERRTRHVIAGLPDGTYHGSGELEGDGVVDVDIPIRVAVTVAGQEMTVDFTGTAAAVPGNVNCPLAVTRSACYFALRVLLPDDLPANAGTYVPLHIVAPEGSLVNARPPSAVVAGNVETSQRIADTVLGALAQVADLPAYGQGTMNNLVIGGDGWTYYETVAGGQGASSRGSGPSGVHVGMTNTLNTPIEALELEYPMRVERYELAADSGGQGRHHGGDGVVRAIRVLEQATLSLLTDRRRHQPAGARGGGPGASGQNLLNGRPLPAKVSQHLDAGDVVTVITPGGGGWGAPDTTDGGGAMDGSDGRWSGGGRPLAAIGGPGAPGRPQVTSLFDVTTASPIGRSFGEEGALLTYGSYLRLEQLLGQQVVQSDPPAHDELLFITIHQVYELWFKQLLHELEATREAMLEGRLWWASHLLSRIRVIEQVLVEQVGVLETMTPQDFLQFRSGLAPASGFQSVQFRELEFLSGAKDPGFLDRFRGLTDEERARLARRLVEPTVWDAFVAVLVRHQLPAGEDAEILQSLLVVARDREHYGDIWVLAEALLDHDESAALWRSRHVMMVERQIGTKSGTGGSSGGPYLRRRLPLRYYPLLWELRDLL